MRKIIAALALTSITAPAWADATETVDPKSAVDFVLSTCLPAMDDVTHVEKIARENNWFQLPTTALDSKYTTPHSRWITNGIMVITWMFKSGNVPNCFVGFFPYKNVNRDKFLETVSTSLELKLTSEILGEKGYRSQTYHIVGKGLLFMFTSRDNDALSVAIWKDVEDKQ
jgi:hypothetical protein